MSGGQEALDREVALAGVVVEAEDARARLAFAELLGDRQAMVVGDPGALLVVPRPQRPRRFAMRHTERIEELDEALGLAMGADDYITKPFTFKDLKATIDLFLT